MHLVYLHFLLLITQADVNNVYRHILYVCTCYQHFLPEMYSIIVNKSGPLHDSDVFVLPIYHEAESCFYWMFGLMLTTAGKHETAF